MVKPPGQLSSGVLKTTQFVAPPPPEPIAPPPDEEEDDAPPPAPDAPLPLDAPPAPLDAPPEPWEPPLEELPPELDVPEAVDVEPELPWEVLPWVPEAVPSGSVSKEEPWAHEKITKPNRAAVAIIALRMPSRYTKASVKRRFFRSPLKI